MEHTPDGTPVGVDDPYSMAGVCDHLTDDGRCRFALRRSGDDPAFAADRRDDDYACHVGAENEWKRCPHYRFTTGNSECVRCGLEEVRLAHDDARPLVEEHHLSYGSAVANDSTDAGSESGSTGGSHEITVSLCRWCHSKVHTSFARVDDDVNPDPEAVAERESRRSKEQSETGFETARERFSEDDST